jgi:DNA polymerase (family 10)
MTNDAIAENFSLLSKLMDIHGENSFKAKSYSTAAYTIEKLQTPLANMPTNAIFAIKGIGESAGQKILEQLQTGKLALLEEYINKTPLGVIEMLHIKGIGPKKIATIWKEMGIESVGELLYACNENRLTFYKGFGEKTQQTVKENIEFYLNNQGNYLYQQVESYAFAMQEKLEQIFKPNTFLLTGAIRRQLETTEKIEWVTNTTATALINFYTQNNYVVEINNEGYIGFRGKENILLGFYITEDESLYTQLFATSCSQEFLTAFINTTGFSATEPFSSEEEIFSLYNMAFIPAYLREDASVITNALNNKLPQVITTNSIKGIIHCHSNWSDGTDSLEAMAHACQLKGLEYLVISDHSKTAGYAQGLPVEKVLAQHQLINELNSQLAPFKIFKSIESDILSDGSLDYDKKILQEFDIIIASIHSNLKMTEEKAMQRLLTAISNPFTAILGHLTGRLLLSRNGYPVNHNTIIEACAQFNVAIELNAHPRRLDIDWRYINAAIQKNVLISINPDAHAIDGFEDCKYGVLVAQKAGLAAAQNLSSFNLAQFEEFVSIQKAKRK